jgi:hypothetical protein
MEDLAFTLRWQGKYAKALAMMRACYELRKDQRGNDSIDTTSVLQTLKAWVADGDQMAIGPEEHTDAAARCLRAKVRLHAGIRNMTDVCDASYDWVLGH